jgi:hypothetical protein
VVLQLVFREPAEIVHATTTPVCPPPLSNSQIRAECVRPFNGFKRGYFPRVHAALVRLVGSSFPQLQRGEHPSKPWVRGSFVVSDEHLINADYIQSLARGRSSNDEAQAWGSGLMERK